MIHKSSVIDSKAKIGTDVKIGPFSFVGPNVELKDGVELVSNVHIEGNTKIGNNTKIFPFASIGTQPQDLKYKGENNSLEIGDYNVIREYVTVNPGTSGGGSKTIIGNNCLFTALVIGLILVPIPPAKIIPFLIIYFLIFCEYLFFLKNCNTFYYYYTNQKSFLYLH